MHAPSPAPSRRAVARQVYAEFGLAGFWNGTAASLIMVVNPTLQYALYEWLQAARGRLRCLGWERGGSGERVGPHEGLVQSWGAVVCGAAMEHMLLAGHAASSRVAAPPPKPTVQARRQGRRPRPRLGPRGLPAVGAGQGRRHAGHLPDDEHQDTHVSAGLRRAALRCAWGGAALGYGWHVPDPTPRPWPCPAVTNLATCEPLSSGPLPAPCPRTGTRPAAATAARTTPTSWPPWRR